MPASRENLYRIANMARGRLWEIRSFYPLDSTLAKEIAAALNETNELAQAYEASAATAGVLRYVLERFQGVFEQLQGLPHDRVPREFAMDVDMVVYEIQRALSDAD
jgi:hypothetical protein